MNTHRLYYQEIEDCEQVRIVTPDDNYELISELDYNYEENPWNTRRYVVRLSNNCCPDTTILSPVHYLFDLTVPVCFYQDITNEVTYTFNITGINTSYIQRIEVDFGTGLQQILYNPITQGFSFTSTFNTLTTLFPLNLPVRLTHVDGFVYNLILVVSPLGNDFCDYTTMVTVTPPSRDSRLNVQYDNLNNPYILLTDLWDVDVMTAGVYNVIISRETNTTGVSVQNHTFLKCDLICAVINKIVQCRDSDVMTFYDALIMSNLCDTVYTDICSLYELLMLKLNNPGCYNPFEDCNCDDSVSGTSYSYRQPNSSYKPAKKPCGPCTS